MVEINNQRKAFLDMLAWSEGTDNGRQKTRNHGYDVIVGGELFTDYSDHPRKLVTLNLQINHIRRTLPASSPVGGMPTASSLAWKTSLRKVRTLWHCSRLWAWRHLWLIVVISVRQSTVAAISGFTAGRWLWPFEHKAYSLIAKFKEAAERSERLMYEQESLAIIPPGYLHHRLPVMGC